MIWRLVTAAFVGACVLSGCEEDYPPCSPFDEGVGGGGSDAVQAASGIAAVAAVAGAVSTGAYGAGSDGDIYGYSRNPSGEVCECDAQDMGCVREPPPPMPVCGSDEDPGYGLCDWNHGTLPETPTICGNVYWCCFSIRCEDGHKWDSYDNHICPKQRGQDDSRAGAWTAWRVHVKAELAEAKKNHGVCWIREASCYDEPPGKTCGNYPN